MKHRLLAAQLLGACLVTACSTPQVALDQANHGVRLIENLQTELVRYKAGVKLSADRRLSSIQRDETDTSSLVVSQQMDAYLLSKAGMDSELAARDRIRDASDTYAKLLAQQDKTKQDLAVRLSELVKDLPTPTNKLNAVQKAMAELGTELSAKERVEIVTTFLKQAKCIADQAGKAAALPAPGASTEVAAPTPASAASAPTTALKCTSDPEQTKEQA